ncbi:MAG: sensor domain-containing diguanylate cyclase [Candidatus Carbobacillus sp.]|nr:sensor domain-containing diguanylate cyclase [Candidatus Carbobacillus sp.]
MGHPIKEMENLKKSTCERLINIFVIILWIGIFIPFTWQAVLHIETLTHSDMWAIFLLQLLFVLVSAFPMKFKGTTVTLDSPLSLAAYLMYGFWVEATLMQLSIVTLLLVQGILSYKRYAINMLIFLSVSSVSAWMFEMVYAWTHAWSESLALFISSLFYVAGRFISNEVLLYPGRYLLYRTWGKMDPQEMSWHALTTFAVAPFGLLFFKLYEDIGLFFFLYILIPFVLLAGMLKLYHQLSDLKKLLSVWEKAVRIWGGTLELEPLLDRMYGSLQMIFGADRLYIKIALEDGTYIEKTYEDVAPTRWVGSTEAMFDSLWSELSRTKRHIKTIRWLGVWFQGVAIGLYDEDQLIGVIVLIRQSSPRFTGAERVLLKVLAEQFGLAIGQALAYQKVRARLFIDTLTSLGNYRAFDQRLREWFDLAKNEGRPFSLLMIDLDHFKKINDTYGHPFGDQVLQKVAQTMIDVVMDEGEVFRYGGEEFVVLLPNKDRYQAFAIAETMRQKVSELQWYVEPLHGAPHLKHMEADQKHMDTVQHKKELVTISLSIGLASMDEDQDMPEELVRQADRAMYVGAKERGRNRVADYRALG